MVCMCACACSGAHVYVHAHAHPTLPCNCSGNGFSNVKLQTDNHPPFLAQSLALSMWADIIMMKNASVKGTLLCFLFVGLVLARIALIVYQFPTPGILLWLLLESGQCKQVAFNTHCGTNHLGELLNSRDVYSQIHRFSWCRVGPRRQ